MSHRPAIDFNNLIPPRNYVPGVIRGDFGFQSSADATSIVPYRKESLGIEEHQLKTLRYQHKPHNTEAILQPEQKRPQPLYQDLLSIPEPKDITNIRHIEAAALKKPQLDIILQTIDDEHVLGNVTESVSSVNVLKSQLMRDLTHDSSQCALWMTYLKMLYDERKLAELHEALIKFIASASLVPPFTENDYLYLKFLSSAEFSQYIVLLAHESVAISALVFGIARSICPTILGVTTEGIEHKLLLKLVAHCSLPSSTHSSLDSLLVFKSFECFVVQIIVGIGHNSASLTQDLLVALVSLFPHSVYIQLLTNDSIQKCPVVFLDDEVSTYGDMVHLLLNLRAEESHIQSLIEMCDNILSRLMLDPIASNKALYFYSLRFIVLSLMCMSRLLSPLSSHSANLSTVMTTLLTLLTGTKPALSSSKTVDTAVSHTYNNVGKLSAFLQHDDAFGILCQCGRSQAIDTDGLKLPFLTFDCHLIPADPQAVLRSAVCSLLLTPYDNHIVGADVLSFAYRHQEKLASSPDFLFCFLACVERSSNCMSVNTILSLLDWMFFKLRDRVAMAKKDLALVHRSIVSLFGSLFVTFPSQDNLFSHKPGAETRFCGYMLSNTSTEITSDITPSQRGISEMLSNVLSFAQCAFRLLFEPQLCTLIAAHAGIAKELCCLVSALRTIGDGILTHGKSDKGWLTSEAMREYLSALNYSVFIVSCLGDIHIGPLRAIVERLAQNSGILPLLQQLTHIHLLYEGLIADLSLQSSSVVTQFPQICTTSGQAFDYFIVSHQEDLQIGLLCVDKRALLERTVDILFLIKSTSKWTVNMVLVLFFCVSLLPFSAKALARMQHIIQSLPPSLPGNALVERSLLDALVRVYNQLIGTQTQPSVPLCKNDLDVLLHMPITAALHIAICPNARKKTLQYCYATYGASSILVSFCFALAFGLEGNELLHRKYKDLCGTNKLLVGFLSNNREFYTPQNILALSLLLLIQKQL